MAKIMIVDDDEKFRAMLAAYLSGHGHQVACAADPVNLVAVAKEHRPNLVLLDMQMPAGGGAQAVKNLSSVPELAKVPVIFCTGMPPQEMKKWFPKDHRRRYIGKPVDFLELRKLVKELLELPSE